jgi:hypothetical protein
LQQVHILLDARPGHLVLLQEPAQAGGDGRDVDGSAPHKRVRGVGAEFSIELDPDVTTDAQLELLVAHGANRVSFVLPDNGRTHLRPL